MAEFVIMPKQGQSVESCIITRWYKSAGDKVKTGDLLFSYETDKAAFDEESKFSGTLLSILYEEGDEVPVLANVAIIGQPGESADHAPAAVQTVEEKKPVEPKPEQHSIVQQVVIDETGSTGKIRISPRARCMASALGINPELVRGTGPNGRIVAKDIEQFSVQKPVAGAWKELHTPVAGDADSRLVPHSNVRKIIARGMQASLQNSAQLTHHLSADARKILALRKAIKSKSGLPGSANITLNDMICYALIRVLKNTPGMNAHYSDEGMRLFHKVHLGMAVDTDRGLMVPVLKNADEYTLQGLSSQLKNLAERCRSGKIDPELLQPAAASFTVSNLGSYDIEIFTPVLNLPQVGILGVNTIRYTPSDLGDGSIGFIPVIGLSLTYDHRAVDGAPASKFLKDLKDKIAGFDADPEV